MNVKQFLNYVISLPKSVYFNFRMFPIRTALNLPVLVSYNVKFLNLKRGTVLIDSDFKIKPLSIIIGFNGTECVPTVRSSINFQNGLLIFKGTCHIAKGCSIDLTGGTLILGKNFSANKNFFVSCSKEITFGDDALLGWNVHLFDATGHIIYHRGILKDSYKSIHIGNHVWLCAESHILKGAKIPDNSVVAYGSIVTKEFSTPNALYGGFPAKEIQNDITWGNFKDLV